MAMILVSGDRCRICRRRSRLCEATFGWRAAPRSNSTTSGSMRRTSASACSEVSPEKTSRSENMPSSSRRRARSFSRMRSFRCKISAAMGPRAMRARRPSLQPSVKASPAGGVPQITQREDAAAESGACRDRLRPVNAHERIQAVPRPALHERWLASRLTLTARVAWLAAVLFAEKSALNLLVDFRLADAAGGLAVPLRLAQHFGLRFAVTFAVALALLLQVRPDPALLEVNAHGREAPLRPAWLALHCALMAAAAGAIHNLYGDQRLHLPFALLGPAAVLLSAAATVALLLALAPWPLWQRAARAIGIRWAYSAFAAVVGTGAILWSQELWAPTAELTFDLVRDVLSPVLPTLQADAATRILRTPRFAIEVSSICSGLEGVGLMLAFCGAWLLYFRAEYRFPRALLLVPAGVLLIFALNVVRIAALVLIGNAGHPAIAIYGF